MPNFDQRGPAGEGPMTGRKMGRCTGIICSPSNQQDAEVSGVFQGRGRRKDGGGRGHGFGLRVCARGRGTGRRNRFRGTE